MSEEVTTIDFQFEPNAQEKKKEHYIAFRIKYSAIKDHDQFKRILHGYTKWYVVEEHKSTNYHIQGVIFIRGKSMLPKSCIDKFRLQIRSLKWFHGNKDYALKLGDGNEKYLIYLSKGDKKGTQPIIYYNNYVLEDTVRLYHNKYWEENKKYKTTDAHRKYAKIIALELPEKYEQWQPEKKMAIKIIKYHDEQNLLIPDDYAIKKMVRTYLLKMEEEEENKYKYIERIVKKMYDYP